MQPIKLTINGEYWDSQIYSGRLYLFTRNGSIRVCDWDKLVEEYPIGSNLRLAMNCAFSRSDFLYGAAFRPLFKDLEILDVMRRKFDGLANQPLMVDSNILFNYIIEADNHFPFPHTDSRIYSRAIYVSAQRGVWEAPCHKRLVRGIGQRPVRRWDAPVLSIDIYGSALAMAGGSEGLFETPIGEPSWYYGDGRSTTAWKVSQIAAKDCSSCNWAFTSVFGSSHSEGGFLAEFQVEETRNGNTGQLNDEDSYERKILHNKKPRKRTFDRIRKASEIFRHRGYSWAYRDKFYQASDSGIRVRRFQPWKEDEDEVIQSLGEIRLQPWKGKIVSAGVAVFGSIVECDNAVVVIASDGNTHTIPGEPVRWRVFPRSKHYENQLHIIYDDRLEIWSFNHDYFVEQSTKRLGVEPFLGFHA